MSDSPAYLVRFLRGEMRRLTGREYRLKLDALDLADLRELVRFVRDAESESQLRARQAQRTPWRRA